MNIENLKELEKESIKKRTPIIGPEKGSWLLEQIQELKPKRVLELGTANGYSGIILGSEEAEVTTIEIDKHIAEEAEQNFKNNKINADIIIGDGVKIVEDLVIKKQKYDLIFIDFYKHGYIKVLDNCIKLLNDKGIIIADNISFSGCQDFREAVLNHPQLKTKLIQIKDGLSLSKKI